MRSAEKTKPETEKSQKTGKSVKTRNLRALRPGEQQTAKALIPIGLLLRMLPAFALVTGLWLFTDNAFGIHGSKPVMTALIAVSVALFTVMRWNKIVFVIGWVLTAGMAVCVFWGHNPITYLIELFVSFFDTAVSYMMRIGYSTLYVFLIDSDLPGEVMAEYAKLFMGILTVLVCMTVAFCTAKRVKVLPLALIVAVDYFVIFMYNISYSKWGFALSLAGIAGILCQRMTDRGQSYGTLTPVEADKKARRRVEMRGYAVGGVCSAFAGLLILGILAIPAAKVKNIWKTYESIDTVMETIRSYEVALITGEDMQISDLGLTGAAEILEARSSLATPRSFTGKPVLEIQSNVNLPVYLRSWISSTFKEDKWYVATDAQRKEYKNVFNDTFRAEDITYYFYRNMNDKLIRYNSPTAYGGHEAEGYVTSLISVKNLGVSGNILFLPERFDSVRSLYNYGQIEEPYAKRWINYFDGIAYSRAFHKGAQYSAVAYLPLYKDEEWMQNLNAKRYVYDLYMSLYEYLGDTIALYQPDEGVPFRRQIQDLIDGYGARSDEERAVYEEEMKSVFAYNDYVENSTLYTSLTEDEELNAKLRELAVSIVCEEPLPETGIEIYVTPTETKDLTDILCSSIDYDQTWLNEDAEPYTVPSPVHMVENRAGDGSLIGNLWYIDDFDAFSSVTSANNMSYYAPEFARRIAKYLSENMTYTLYPSQENMDEEMSSVERFLFVTKEGYCVQYATAATLLLRSLGIPARYVEGYIAPKLTRNQAEEKVGGYIANVKDKNAHAWVEIYLPNYGWMTEEVTSPYYSDMYDPYERITYSHYEPSDTVTPETPEEIEDDPVEEEDTFWDIWGGTVITVCIVTAVLAALVFAAVKYFSYQQGKRYLHEEALKQAKRGLCTEEERQEISHALYDHLMRLVRVFGMKPVTGETPAAFVKRLDLRFRTSGGGAVSVLPVIEKNEFGLGVTAEELAGFADYCIKLEDVVRAESGFFKMAWITYFRGLM